MKSAEAVDKAARQQHRAPVLASLCCLLPLIVFWGRFRELYWFHDDWDLVSDMDRFGAAWLMQPFAENFVPLFKALWHGAVVLVNGSYFGMILLLWATHVAILLLFAAILAEFDWRARVLAVLTVGLAWSNIETLGWATQWSSLLSTLFFLLGWLLLMRAGAAGGSKRLVALGMLAALASALSFSRGALAGAALAVFAVRRGKVRTAIAMASVTVACLLAYRGLLESYSHFQDVGGKLGAMASYAVHVLLVNPLFLLLPMRHSTFDGRALALAAVCKVAVVGAGYWLATGSQRRVLRTLLAFEAGTAVLLGMGRYNLGLATAASSRYQYVSLLSFAPFVSLIAARLLRRRVVFAGALAMWIALLAAPWFVQTERWAEWRGTAVKQALAGTHDDQRFGLPLITAGRARELIRRYNLH